MSAKLKAILLASLFIIAYCNAAAAQNFVSSDKAVALIELYTSEGCSSCPPADRWLSKLKQKPQLWSEFVPVAFHVDYWDYIGWVDRFADPSFSQRHRQYAAQYSERAVYTPGMRKAGESWGGWRYKGNPALNNQQIVGVLELQLDEAKNFSARFAPSVSSDGSLHQKNLTLNIALLGMSLSSEVQRGENQGKQLKHDFVVLKMLSINSQNLQWQGQLPNSKLTAPSYAIAAWVSETSSLTPIQAVGGLLN